MYYLQILEEGTYYHLLARRNRIVTRSLLLSEDKFIDRNGGRSGPKMKTNFRVVFDG